MSSEFYTNISVWGSKILYRGIDNGKKVRRFIDYNPTLFVPSKEPTKYKTIRNEYVQEIKPGSIRECRDFVRTYDNVEGFKIYGNQKYHYAFLAETFPGEVAWDRSYITTCNIDIEVGSESGFPEPASASEPITAITMKTQKDFVVFASGDFNNHRSDVRYVKCVDEIDILKRFVDEWTSDYPDIITGWNVKFFDIPYLVNRITKLLGEKFAKRLSPWNYLKQKIEETKGYSDQMTYVISGISVLDYIELYKKYAPEGKSRDSYTLDNICSLELSERKLSYEEYGNLHRLYKDNFQKFIEYNIRDVELVEKLDNKLKLIDLALTLAYSSHSNMDDVFQQVKMWDNIIYNYLISKNIIVPPSEKHEKDRSYAGAYVKEPIPSMYHWIASFDLASLYPSLIMQFNISPDTFIEPDEYTEDMRHFLSSQRINVEEMLKKSVDTTSLKNMNATLTPNEQLFDLSRKGFLPEIMEKMFDSRQVYKKKMLESKKKLEKTTDTGLRFELEHEISKYDNLQLAMKVSLNSAYGALGSKYFRFFDVRQAAAITTSGQFVIQWIQNSINEYLNRMLSTDNKDYIIASDTDSVYLNLDELVRQVFAGNDKINDPREVIAFMDRACESKIQPFIDKCFKELTRYTNALDHKMFMKREALADRGIWTAKKRYLLNVYNNEGVEYTTPKIKVVGLEMIKSSTPFVCREKLWKALDVIMNEDQSTMLEFIDDFRKEFRTLPAADIASPRSVNNILSYSDSKTLYGPKTPIHVRGSIMYNHFIKKNRLEKKYPLIHEGEKIKFIYLKEPNYTRGNIISFPMMLPPELNLDSFIDHDTQFDKSFLDPLKVLLNIIGWRSESGNSLMDFFS